jgi:multidrug resistance efflux pump
VSIKIELSEAEADWLVSLEGVSTLCTDVVGKAAAALAKHEREWQRHERLGVMSDGMQLTSQHMQDKATNQLIAAAPELAEALEDVLRSYVHAECQEPDVMKARAILKKAGW